MPYFCASRGLLVLEQGIEKDVPLWRDRSLAFRFGKRSVDLGLGLPMLIFSLPIQAIIALVIRFDSPGPVLFRQDRLSLDQSTFLLYKFRTMYVDSRERFPETYNYDEIVDKKGNMPVKRKDDPRLTRFGAFLRRTSLDELPNLWNVVKGEMSLVGPRPEIRELLGCYGPQELLAFRVKPGLTGLAQVMGRNALTVAETLAFDLSYARRASLALDCWILLRTLPEICDFRSTY